MFQLMNQEDAAGKIDNKRVDGLLGTPDSLAYKVHEIERHLHSGGRWFGKAASPTATHFADRIGTTITPFQLDGGNNTWGAWTQLFGSDDTPLRTGYAYFDPHQLILNDTQNASDYFIQIGRGASGAAALTAESYMEFVVVATVQKATEVIPLQTGRAPAGSLLWGRCWCVGSNTGTIDFWLGIHEYEG
jgi:hypothetical protein